MYLENQVPPFLRKMDLIRGFFQQLMEATNKENIRDSSFDSARHEESLTQRLTVPVQVNAKKRVNYLKRKQQAQAAPTEPLRPSDIILIEQNRKTIDQFVKDNQILHGGLQDCMHVIDVLKKRIQILQEEKSQQNYKARVVQLEKEIHNKDHVIKKQAIQIDQMKAAQEKIISLVESHSKDQDEDWQQSLKYISELETENLFLRQALGMNYTEEQIQSISLIQQETELSFFDNFCVSRRDLEKKAALEYEQLLESRKTKIEEQFVEWHMNCITKQMSYQQQEPMYEGYDEEEPIQAQPQVQNQLSKEEKAKRLEELLKPIGKAQSQINIQDQQISEAKKKQLDILSMNNQTPQKKDVKSNTLSVEVEESTKIVQNEQQIITLDSFDDEPDDDMEVANYAFQQTKTNNQNQQQVNKPEKKKEIMSSIEQGMQKLKSLGQKQNIRYQDADQSKMFKNEKNQFQYDYDQDYSIDDDDDDMYQKILENQKQLALQKHPLSKTKKNQELQYQI